MIYLDNSATTELSKKARSAMMAAMDSYGNPSSLHSLGFEANKALAAERKAIMSALGAKNGRLIFTSCGSEASNLAIKGSAMAKSRRTANRIITTDSEHPSVENVLLSLEKQGLEIYKIPTRLGKLDLNVLEDALSKPVFMATLMLVNNETGSIYDVKSVFSSVKNRYPEAICHCDAVQGFLKVAFTPTTLGADMITVSAHKIHGPKGVGALWVSDRIIKEKRLVPLMLGGGQESGLRSGTENTVGIAGFAAAAEEGIKDFEKSSVHVRSLREYAIKKIKALDKGIVLNIPENAAPHIISITLPNIKSETMLHYLSGNGICVSSGSACSSHSNKPSGTLIAFGLTPKQADCTIRISLSEYNKESDIDILVSTLGEGVDSLIRFK